MNSSIFTLYSVIRNTHMPLCNTETPEQIFNEIAFSIC